MEDPSSTLIRLYRAHFSYVWRSVERFGARSDTEDIVQEVFARAWKALPGFDNTRPERPWLFGIALRVCKENRRARSRTPLSTSPPEIVDEAPLPDTHVALAERRRMLLLALDSIEIERRAVLVLHDLDEVSIPEIAAALEIPENTAWSRLRIARRELAESLKRLRLQGAHHATT